MNQSELPITSITIANLRPHPRQAEFFDSPPHEVQELADDLERNGLRVPIDILPDGTILAGHRRVAAATLLGWPEIDAKVRDDLADDPEGAERLLIEDNLYRRHMGPLGIARCYRAVKELEIRRARRERGRVTEGIRLGERDRQEVRDRIGKRFGMSGRTLDRYVRVLDGCPPAVLTAVEADALSLQIAEKIAGLDPACKQQIIEAIQSGTPPREAAKAVLDAAMPPVRIVSADKGRFLRSLSRGVTVYNEDPTKFGPVSANQLEILRQGEDLLERLLQHAAGSVRSC